MKPILDVIKCESGNHQLVWKHPAEDFNTHSVLIVQEGQFALLYKDGQIADIFKAGRYVLETKNIPILRKIIQIPTGGMSTFCCQVYFVNMVEAMDIKWGLPSRATWKDPVYGIKLNIGVRGNLSIKVADPASVVVNLVGAGTTLTAEGLCGYFRDMISMRVKSYLAKFVSEKKIDVFSLDENQGFIAEELERKLCQDFLSYGFNLGMFTIAEFVYPEDDPTYMRLLSMISERSIGVEEAETARMQATIAARASAESEVIRGQGHAAALAAMGSNYVTERQLDIAENMSKNESMNQFSGMAGSMAMLGGALNLGGQAAGIIGNAMQGTGAMNIAGNPYMQPYGGVAGQQPMQPQGQQNAAVETQNQPENKTKLCIHCQKSIPIEAKFCLECGEKQPLICRKCGRKLPDEAKFCLECGERV